MRFGEYAFIFICLTASVGLSKVFYKSKRYMKVLIILVFISSTFLSISNDFTSSDNPLVKRPFYTYYLTNEEIIGFNHVSNISTEYVMADYVTFRYLSYTQYKNKSHILEIDNQNMRFLRNSGNDIILIRNKELVKRPLKLYPSTSEDFQLNPYWISLDYYYNDIDLWKNLERYNKIYESNSIRGYN